MRQTVTNLTTKHIRTLCRLEFGVAQAKTERGRIHHLEKKAEAVLLRSSLEELAASADSSNRLLAVCDYTTFLRRVENIEESFKPQKNTQFSYRMTYPLS